MSLAEMQACLAHLYVNDAFRRLFHAAPHVALADYDLSGREAAAIEAIDPHMLAVFAGSLKNKRKRRFERAYLSSFALHRPAMERAWRRFVDLYGARPVLTVHQEILEFGHFAEQMLSDREHFPEHAPDLVRFERLGYDAAFVQPAPRRGDGGALAGGPKPALSDVPAIREGVLIADFQYEVTALEAAGRDGGSAAESEPDPHTIVFRPQGSDSEQRMVRVNDATATVLRLCDGSSTVSEIVQEVEARLSAADLSDAIVDTIDRLQALEILFVGPRREQA